MGWIGPLLSDYMGVSPLATPTYIDWPQTGGVEEGIKGGSQITRLAGPFLFKLQPGRWAGLTGRSGKHLTAPRGPYWLRETHGGRGLGCLCIYII